MKVKKIIDNTTSRSEFNRAYKRYLESKGKIHCSYCGYHCNENSSEKHYGGYVEPLKYYNKINYPSWKMTHRNKKQWEKRKLEYTTDFTYMNREYLTITW